MLSPGGAAKPPGMRSPLPSSAIRPLWLGGLALLTLAAAARADEAGRREWERARAGNGSPAYLIQILDGLIADESEPREQRAQWRLERERLAAELTRSRAADIALKAETGAAASEILTPLREAVDSLRALERTRRADPARDPALIRRLQRQINWIELRPLAEELERALTRARSADRTESERAYLRARELQSDINRRFPDAAQASEARLKMIDDELAAVRRGDREAALARLLDAAEAEARAEKTDEQEQLLARALKLRNELDAGLPPIEIASKRQAFAKRAQTIRALPRVLLATRLEAEAAASLRTGDTDTATARLGQALATLSEASEKFPLGVELEPGLRDRLTYLGPRRARLGDLQREFNATLAPVPGRPGVSMMKIEMPQGLHERVANLNPSRVPGVKRPVESTSWWDAAAAAERLGWIMGAEVRLPTRAEWVAALADGEQAGWLSENAEGAVRETGLLAANPAGFHDLVGNVAEWLKPEAGQPDLAAEVAGGSVAETLAAVLAEPVRRVNASRRDRLIGYRLVLVRPAP